MKSISICAAVFAALGLAAGFDAPAAMGGGSSAGHASTMMAPASRNGTTTTITSNVAPARTAQATQATTTTRGPSKTGQPNQDCESLGNQPGHSMSAPGSAFNPDGNAGTHYAGEQPQNSRNTASVSQYDVACARPAR